MKKLVIFGLADLAELVNFYFEHDSDYQVTAFTVDHKYKKMDQFCGLPVYDFEEISKQCPPEQYEMFIAIGYSHMNQIRQEKYKTAKQKGYRLASYISTHATCLIERSHIGENCLILEDSTIQPFVEIGNNVIIWSGGHIGHHAKIGDHVFLAPHVALAGRTCVGNNCFLGINATVHDHVVIGENCVIGAGALITRDTEPGAVYKAEYARKDGRKSGEVTYFT